MWIAWRRYVLCVLLLVPISGYADSDETDESVQVRIADPFIEIHTGPGRGYPVFFVVDRGQLVEVQKRKTDWFKVRYRHGEQEENVIEGWVNREQMQATLTPQGDAVQFTDLTLESFSGRRWEAGMMGGTFNGAAVMTVYGGYAPLPTLSYEISLSQSIGDYSSSLIYNLNILSHPFPRWRYSPFFTIGIGYIHTSPDVTLVQAPDTDDAMAHVGIGLKTYLTRRFMLRVEYKDYIAFSSDDDNEEFEEWKAGFAFFF